MTERETTAAIRTALTKRYGETLALDAPRLHDREGEVYGYLGPNGSGKTTTIRLLLGLHRPTAGRAELFGLDAWRDPVAAHRRVAYVAGEPFLWPALTSAETFAFLARCTAATDVAYRELLVERFQLDADKKVRALSKGNRQKVQLVAAFATRADLLILDEPTSGARPADGGGVPRDRARGEGARADGLPLLAHPQRGRGALRPGRHPPRGPARRRGHARGAAPPRRPDGRGHVRRAGAGAPPRCPASASRAPGPNALRFEVSGSVGPLLAALAAHPVLALTSREPSLEEIFLHHYDGSDGRVGG